MRISDWSSDVCSSDLVRRNQPVMHDHLRLADQPRGAQRQQFRIARTRADKGDSGRWNFSHAGQMAKTDPGFNSECVGRAEGKFGEERFDPSRCRPVANRKSVVEGKSVSVGVDLGGRRIIKKTK